MGVRVVEEERLLTVAQVARLLQVNVETVRTWLRSGELEGIRLDGKAADRVSEAGIRRFLDRRRQARVMPPDSDTTTDAGDAR
jgi:excisionase family DNA binding protein